MHYMLFLWMLLSSLAISAELTQNIKRHFTSPGSILVPRRLYVAASGQYRVLYVGILELFRLNDFIQIGNRLGEGFVLVHLCRDTSSAH